MSPQHPEGHVFYRKMHLDYPTITHAEGVYLVADNGDRYLDACGGAVVVNTGQGVKSMATAIAEQIWLVSYVHAEKFTTPVLEKYANELAKIISLPDARFYLLTTGSEANEAAMKFARQIQMIRGQPGRHLVVGRWNSYHGITLGTLAVGGRKLARQRFLPMMADMPHIPPPACYRCPLGKTYPNCKIACADALEEMVEEHGADQIAAFIAEPVSGAALAATVPPPEYWPRIREICDRHGILLIADEVMCGFGRTGKWCAYEHFGFVPDILTMGKGVAGGVFPLSVMAARGSLVDELYASGQDIAHGGTFSHHAVGAAAGLATLQYIEKHALVNAAAKRGAQLGKMLHETLDDIPGVGDIRGMGMMWGIEFVKDKDTREPFEETARVAIQVFNAARDMGLMVYPGRGAANGFSGDVIMVAPPSIIGKKDLKRAVKRLRKAIVTALTPLLNAPPIA